MITSPHDADAKVLAALQLFLIKLGLKSELFLNRLNPPASWSPILIGDDLIQQAKEFKLRITK